PPPPCPLLPYTTLFRSEDLEALEGGSRCPPPRHGPLLEEPHEQLELLLEQHLVVREREPEQPEGLDERAASEDDLGASRADRVRSEEHTSELQSRENLV